MTMSRALKSPIRVLASATLALLILGATPAAGLTIEAGTWSGPAFPNGTAATTNVTVTYGCGELIPPPVGADIALEVSLEADAEGSISSDADALTPKTPLADEDCTPGEDVVEEFNITYTATAEQLAGTLEVVSLRASHNVSEEAGGDEDEDTTEALVGPLVDVMFSARNDTFEVIGGERVDVDIEIRSESNTEVQGQSELELPETEEGEEAWEPVSIDPVSVPSPLEDGQEGVAVITFEVLVPEEADGEHTLIYTGRAESSSEPPLTTDPVEIPLTFEVTPRSVAEGDDEGSPAPGVLFVLLGVLGTLAWTRRRANR